jgi:hypothetical protein
MTPNETSTYGLVWYKIPKVSDDTVMIRSCLMIFVDFMMNQRTPIYIHAWTNNIYRTGSSHVNSSGFVD